MSGSSWVLKKKWLLFLLAFSIFPKHRSSRLHFSDTYRHHRPLCSYQILPWEGQNLPLCKREPQIIILIIHPYSWLRNHMSSWLLKCLLWPCLAQSQSHTIKHLFGESSVGTDFTVSRTPCNTRRSKSVTMRHLPIVSFDFKAPHLNLCPRYSTMRLSFSKHHPATVWKHILLHMCIETVTLWHQGAKAQNHSDGS